ncbi:MAG: c-type cytochrome [Vicinamibacteria bacterium]
MSNNDALRPGSTAWRYRSWAPYIVVGAIAASPAAPAQAHAELPPKNLKVLPQDWSRKQVVEVMKTFTAGLGVRCQYCHVGEEGKPFSEWDFASDKKSSKQRARDMVQLLEEVNRRLGALTNLHGDGSAPLASCATCHHKVARPRPIEDVFEETRGHQGLDAAIKEYRGLRTELSASGSYDFTSRPLAQQASRQLQANDAKGAHKVLDLALDLGLDTLMVRLGMVDVALAEGDKGAALVQLDKAAALPLNDAEKEFVADRRKEVLAGKAKEE